MSDQERLVLLQELSHFNNYISDLKEWSWEELDALKIMIGNLRRFTSFETEYELLFGLLKNFQCSQLELRWAIATQLTCAGWGEGTNEVQHFATTMLAGLAPMPQFAPMAIIFLESECEAVEADPESYEPDEIEQLQSAIEFIKQRLSETNPVHHVLLRRREQNDFL